MPLQSFLGARRGARTSLSALAGLALGLTLIGPGSAFAQADPAADAAPPSRWSGEGELGFSNTSGNSETSSLVARLAVNYERARWLHELALDAVNSREDGTTTAERYTASYTANRFLTEQNYIFASLRYDNDRFSGFDYQISEAVGIGRRFIQRPGLTLDVEAGAGARQRQLENGERENEAIGRLAGVLDWRITEVIGLTENVLIEAGADNTFSESVTKLRVSMSEALSLNIGFTLRNNSDPPADNVATDTLLSISVGYTF